MKRLTTILTITMATTALQAAPPTADDWWTAMGRYTGDHMLKDGESGEVVGTFEVEWGIPFERINYRFQSIGDGPATTLAGFCGWDEKLGKVRFVEVETGADGLVTTMGSLADVDGMTYVWDVRTWNEKKEIRSFQMTDVFNVDGVARSIEMKSGSPVPASLTWSPVNHFQRAFPTADLLVGTWNFTENGQAKIAKVEWGPGKETLVETTHTVGADGKTTEDSTVTYMYDRVADRVRMHFMGANGSAGWATPVIGKIDGATTMEVSWRGRTATGDRISALGYRRIEGDTMTLTMTEFKLDGVPVPAGAARDAMTAAKKLTRAKK
ncbi:MAG: hypothetical protein GWP75_10115 [Planctomycetia bacterium]|nr:hypothetical protein [Planctomycetia bacterium]